MTKFEKDVAELSRSLSTSDLISATCFSVSSFLLEYLRNALAMDLSMDSIKINTEEII